jgi:hypothetical protein
MGNRITVDVRDIYEARTVMSRVNEPILHTRYSLEMGVIYIGGQSGDALAMFASDTNRKPSEVNKGELSRPSRKIVKFPSKISYFEKINNQE